MGESHHRLSTLVICIIVSACHGLLIITVITPLPTKPSASRPLKAEAGELRQLLTCRCVSVMFAARCKIHEELADAKAENDYLRDDVAAGVVGYIKAVWSVRVKPPPPPAWIMQPPRLANTAERDYFHQKAGDPLPKKQLEEPVY